jgi:hypothetical protein
VARTYRNDSNDVILLLVALELFHVLDKRFLVHLNIISLHHFKPEIYLPSRRTFRL